DEASKKDLEDLFQDFYDEYFNSSKIMKFSTTNVESSNVEVPSPEEEVFHEISKSFQGESSSSSLNDDVQQKVGYSQQKGIDYDETFAPVARIEAIRLFLAYVSHKDFTVFQMDIKQRFLMELLRRKCVLVNLQVLSVYALDKALYGLKQTPRAWYDVLSQFLIESGFQKGFVDTTLFIKNKVPTPMVEQAKLDLVGKPVDHTDYRSMIGSLMYVTSSRPDIMFATCMCARYQANPNEHHVSVG
nr:hypothetical protein [Tanacetum cinerariifolium]